MPRIVSKWTRCGRLTLRLALATITIALVTSCGWFSDQTGTSTGTGGSFRCTWVPGDLGPDHYTGGTSVFYHDLESACDLQPISYSLVIDDGPKDVYVVFTNPTDRKIGSPSVELRTAVLDPEEPVSRHPSPAERSAAISHLTSGPVALRDHPDLAGWEPPPLGRATSRGVSEPSTSTSPTFTAVPGPHRYVEGGNPGPEEYSLYSSGDTNTYNFDTYPAGTLVPSILAARREVANTPNGPKTVEIWVEDAEWGGRITQEMADAMADAFLLPGEDNDIYDWVSAVFGEEWSDDAASYSNTIDGHDTITILLYDIDNDNSAGGVVGFFWAKDNFLRSDLGHSNERIMFYIDSATYAATVTGESPWSIDNYWPSEIVSTLAHELQHMIHFHERAVLRGASTPTWLDEAMSLAVEDLVEERRLRRGPRGVDPVAVDDGSAGPTENDRGRLPLYNVANDISLTGWGASPSILESYSMSYAFAAFLGRNFGGAALFREMSRNSSSDPSSMLASSISAAGGPAGLTLKQLLWRWGAAVLLSDVSQAEPYRLNPGTWMESESNGITFSLGSIDHYRYSDVLYVHSGSINTTSMSPASKMLYLVGQGLTGTVELDIDFHTGMDFAVVLK